MSNYSNYSKKTKIRWIVTGVAIFLAFVMIAGLCLQVFGQGKVKPSEWFKGDNTELSPDTSDISGGAVVSEGENKNMRIMSAMIAAEDYDEYGIDAQNVENVFNLSVTYTPEDATFQETTYSIAFKNPNSTWATGKTVTDYATVTQSAVGSKDATLTVLKAFSEQIIVTATCNRNTALKATTTVDYVCDELDIDVSSEMTPIDSDIDFVYKGWKNGTVAPVSTGNITFVYDVGSSFVSAATEAGFTVDRYFTAVLNDPEEDLLAGVSGASIYSIYHSIANYGTMTVEQKKDYDLFLGRRFASGNDGDGIGMYAFGYKRIYNGVDYGGFDPMDDPMNNSGNWYDYDRGTDFDVFEVVATGITTNTSSIVAG